MDGAEYGAVDDMDGSDVGALGLAIAAAVDPGRPKLGGFGGLTGMGNGL